MKIIKLAMLLLCCITVLGCSSKIGCDYPPKAYPIKVAFLDKNGTDLAKDIPYSNGDIESSPDKIVRREYFSTTSVTEGIIVLNTTMNINNLNPNYIYIGAITKNGLLPEYHPREMKFKVVSEYVFKDKNEHEIVVRWNIDNKSEPKAIFISFDGKEFEVREDLSDKFLARYYATIVVD